MLGLPLFVNDLSVESILSHIANYILFCRFVKVSIIKYYYSKNNH